MAESRGSCSIFLSIRLLNKILNIFVAISPKNILGRVRYSVISTTLGAYSQEIVGLVPFYVFVLHKI